MLAFSRRAPCTPPNHLQSGMGALAIAGLESTPQQAECVALLQAALPTTPEMEQSLRDAAEHGDEATLKALLDEKVNIDAKDEVRWPVVA